LYLALVKFHRAHGKFHRAEEEKSNVQILPYGYGITARNQKFRENRSENIAPKNSRGELLLKLLFVKSLVEV